MDDNCDFDSLLNVEQAFYETAYKEAYDHGRIHAAIEGRAMGREKGFEIWEELGFYEGFARLCQATYALQDKQSDRAMHHTTHLLELISKFPRTNPSADVDLSKQTRQIRSRYKALCSTLGIRPSLRAADEGGDTGSATTNARPRNRQVWKLEEDTRRKAAENDGLNF